VPPLTHRLALALSLFGLLGAACGGTTRAAPEAAADGGAGTDAGSSPPPAGEKSGSRVTVRVWSGDDGATETRYAWDESRGVECSPQLAADGTERCLPVSSPGLDLLFSDASCTHALIPSSDASCTPPPRFVVDTPAASCPPAAVHVYEPGAKADAPPRLYARLFGFCLPQQPSSGQELFEGVESKPEDWVALTRETVAVTSELGVSFWTGEDGSRLKDGLVLLPDDVPCELSSYTQDAASGPLLRCLPTARAVEGRSSYMGDTCSSYLTSSPSCQPARLIERVGEATQCGSPVQLFEIGAELDGSAVHQLSGGACTPVPPAFVGQDHYYATGEPLADDRYPRVELLHDGSGRLAQEYLVSDGKKIAAKGIFDTKRKTSCTSVALPDGTTGCVSSGELASFNGDYADPDCTQPVASVACPKEGLTPRAVVVDQPPTRTCVSAVSALRTLGKPYTGPVYARTGASCQEGQRNDVDTYYEVGGPVAPSSLFAALHAATL
jgi:hypothetical protein